MDTLKPIAAALKAARQKKRLSQRELGERVGLPQSHISKIESAAVDLQTSNLMEMARALDLELALLPREMLPAIRALERSIPRQSAYVVAEPAQVPAYSLDNDEDRDGD